MERTQWKIVAAGSAVAGMAVGALVVSAADGGPLPEGITLRSAGQQELQAPITTPAAVAPDSTGSADERSGSTAWVPDVAGPPRAGGDMLTRGYTTTSLASPPSSAASPDDADSAASPASTDSPDDVQAQAPAASIDTPPAPAPAPVAPPPAPGPLPAPAQPDSPDSPASPVSVDT